MCACRYGYIKKYIFLVYFIHIPKCTYAYFITSVFVFKTILCIYKEKHIINDDIY